MASPFLSTLSLRRATLVGTNAAWLYYISIHALLAESDIRSLSNGYRSNISIHALLAESDGEPMDKIAVRLSFLSTLSLRRATLPANRVYHLKLISIHALLAESDWRMPLPYAACQSFLSTLSLRRATIYVSECLRMISDFYPRSPCGERPRGAHPVGKPADISIHALLAESDPREREL